MLLRRRKILEPLSVTTSPAPVLAAGHVDVAAGDPPPPASPAATPCPRYAVDKGLVIDCIRELGHDGSCDPGDLDRALRASEAVPQLRVEGSTTFEPSPAALELVDNWPSIDRGVCYHDLHFEHDGRRFGALIHPHQHSASLLPCPYVGRSGPVNAGGRGHVACTADLHERLLWHVRHGRSVDTAAALLGLSGRSVYRCARRDPLFREQLSKAIVERAGSTLDHGRSRYRQGCRCAICRGANARAVRQHRARTDAVSIGAACG